MIVLLLSGWRMAAVAGRCGGHVKGRPLQAYSRIWVDSSTTADSPKNKQHLILTLF